MNGELGDARITCSPALADAAVEAIIFLARLECSIAPSWGVNWIFSGVLSRGSEATSPGGVD